MSGSFPPPIEHPMTPEGLEAAEQHLRRLIEEEHKEQD